MIFNQTAYDYNKFKYLLIESNLKKIGSNKEDKPNFIKEKELNSYFISV